MCLSVFSVIEDKVTTRTDTLNRRTSFFKTLLQFMKRDWGISPVISNEWCVADYSLFLPNVSLYRFYIWCLFRCWYWFKKTFFLSFFCPFFCIFATVNPFPVDADERMPFRSITIAKAVYHWSESNLSLEWEDPITGVIASKRCLFVPSPAISCTAKEYSLYLKKCLIVDDFVSAAGWHHHAVPQNRALRRQDTKSKEQENQVLLRNHISCSLLYQ